MRQQDEPIRVFLVDDHKTTLWGLERLIESAAPRMQLVGSACNCTDMLARCKEARPDVVVLDLNLGGMDAAEAVPDLLREVSTRILVLTGNNDTDAHQRVMMHGASGVVLKEEGAEVLLAAIEKIHQGEVWLNRLLVGKVLYALAGRHGPNDPDAVRIESLTAREREIIAAIVQNKGARNKVVAERLHISEHTLRNHLAAIYRKLGITGRIELFLYASRHGLGMPPPR